MSARDQEINNIMTDIKIKKAKLRNLSSFRTQDIYHNCINTGTRKVRWS